MMLNLWDCVKVAFAVTLLLLGGCKEEKYPGFSQIGEGIHYKLHTFGDNKGTSASKGDMLRMAIRIYKGDTLIETELFKDADGFDTVPVKDADYDLLTSAFSILEPGDSASFIFDGTNPLSSHADSLMSASLPNPPFRIEARLHGIKPEKVIRKERLLHFLWVKEKRSEEEKLIREFVSIHNITVTPERDNFYYIPESEGEGPSPENGKSVTINYSASFISGKEFYSTFASNESLEFIMGAPGQVLPGMERGISKMREGGKARFIVPSHLAFGEKGSSTGLVGPFKTLIFDVELVKIN